MTRTPTPEYVTGHALGWMTYVTDYQALYRAPDFALAYEDREPESVPDDSKNGENDGYRDGYVAARDRHAEIVATNPGVKHWKVLGSVPEDTAAEYDKLMAEGDRAGADAYAEEHGLPVDEPEPDEVADEDEPGEPEPLLHVVTVIGSYSWINGPAVVGALHQWWLDHDQPSNVRLVTSGCPHGAEAFAREFAVGFGWTNVVMRDEELANIDTGSVFAFVTGESPGAEAAWNMVSSKVWRRIYREETHRPVVPWSNR